MRSLSIPIWTKIPFLRLVLPLITGILLQWYCDFGWSSIILPGFSFSLALVFFRLLPLAMRFKLQPLQGLLINLILIVAGILITYQKDIRHRENWFGNYYNPKDFVVLTITEPLLGKPNSYKAEASVERLVNSNTARIVAGKIIVYFVKDSTLPGLHYGDKIMIAKKIQVIQSPGNPGAFDYKQYAGFHQIFHNVFLRKGEWVLLTGKNINWFKRFLFTTRQHILKVLHKNMKADDGQLSIAEALLIGYTQDLDKDLVQAYSNMGVVHIIAISGMHLGLIYVLLVWILNRVPYLRKSKIVQAIAVLSCLWLFALLTGGGPSILRSAVMFSCIVIGNYFSRTTSIFNSLAASAFILLWLNPFYLWDAGFQLSYLALLGIVIFQKPVYHLLFIKNRVLNKVWELAAVSLAAQLLTFPVCIYYFHQFPLVFLFTNIVTVPLSTLILLVEIFLISIAWVAEISVFVGKITWWLIWLMNKTILFFNDLPYTVWQNIPATVTSTILLYFFVGYAGTWLLKKRKNALTLSLFSLFIFCFLNAWYKWNIAHQQKVIVYNVARHQAIDLVKGNNFNFIGDSALNIGGMLHNFNIKPGRNNLQLTTNDKLQRSLFKKDHFFDFQGKRFLLLDSSIAFKPQVKKMNIDIIIISRNASIEIPHLAQVFNCGRYLFDASNSLWKIEQWKKDCEKLHLPYFSIPEKGAFVLDL